MSRRSSYLMTFSMSSICVSMLIAGWARCALAEARVARGDQPMPGRLHQRVHLLPGPARGPRAVTDEKGFRRSCAHRAVSTRLLLKASIAIVPVRRVV